MMFLFFINTPGQVYTWKNIINILVSRGHKVKILARDDKATLSLLNQYRFEYSSFKSINLKYLKHFELLPYIWKCSKLILSFNPSIMIGFGIDAAFTAALFWKHSIIFTDSEPMPLQLFLIKITASIILTPSSFLKKLGKKQIRIAGYKELAYLHPNCFQPDPSIFNELGINSKEKYAILRFNAFNAIHDIGRHGFSLSDKYELVNQLKKYTRIFISPEGSLPKDLEKYRLPTPYHRIHHALFYAQLLVADTGTMIAEAAVLGTPSILSISSVKEFGNFIELEQKYKLIFNYHEPRKAIDKAIGLIQEPDLKKKWIERQKTLLADKIDVTQFIIDFIENYPESFKEYGNKQVEYSS